jgi:hypothetical protein
MQLKKEKEKKVSTFGKKKSSLKKRSKKMSSEKNDWLGGRSINWGHAFAIVDFYHSGLFTVHLVQIINGKTSLWGELITG